MSPFHFEIINLVFAASNILLGVLLIAIDYPLLKRKVPPNKYYGFRLPRAFESEELWYAINAYGAERMILWSFVLIGLGVAALMVKIQGNAAMSLFFACSSFVILIPIIETWIFSRKLQV